MFLFQTVDFGCLWLSPPQGYDFASICLFSCWSVRQQNYIKKMWIIIIMNMWNGLALGQNITICYR